MKKIELAAAAGIDWIQIREKDLSGRDYGSLTRSALGLARSSVEALAAPQVIVNDRADVAFAALANGVHLGESSLPALGTKKLWDSIADLQGRFGEPFLVGVSCHYLEAARTAQSHGADYVFFGPIFATPSKAAFGPPQGLERLAEVCDAVSIPVLAIGGITLGNAASCLAAGAAGLAAIRLFQDAADLPGLIRSLHAMPTR